MGDLLYNPSYDWLGGPKPLREFPERVAPFVSSRRRVLDTKLTLAVRSLAVGLTAFTSRTLSHNVEACGKERLQQAYLCLMLLLGDNESWSNSFGLFKLGTKRLYGYILLRLSYTTLSRSDNNTTLTKPSSYTPSQFSLLSKQCLHPLLNY